MKFLKALGLGILGVWIVAVIIGVTGLAVCGLIVLSHYSAVAGVVVSITAVGVLVGLAGWTCEL